MGSRSWYFSANSEPVTVESTRIAVPMKLRGCGFFPTAGYRAVRREWSCPQLFFLGSPDGCPGDGVETFAPILLGSKNRPYSVGRLSRIRVNSFHRRIPCGGGTVETCRSRTSATRAYWWNSTAPASSSTRAISSPRFRRPHRPRRDPGNPPAPPTTATSHACPIRRRQPDAVLYADPQTTV